MKYIERSPRIAKIKMLSIARDLSTTNPVRNSNAAEKLRLGQPTLSAQLKQFEDSLGVPLFERHHKKLNLTEQGKIALDYAKNIFRMGSEMYEVLHDRLKPLKPSLHLGALDSVPKQIVLQLVKQAFRI